MAVTTYTVKRGDTLWGICTRYASSISGSTTQAKIDTVCELNPKIKDPDLIIDGWVLKLSGSADANTGTKTDTPSNQATVNGPGLQASDTTGRAVYANWTWTRKNTKNYKYRWIQYVNGKWVVGSEGETTSYEDIYCQSTYTADTGATKVRFQVLPISATYKVKEGNTEVDKAYWEDAEWSAVKEYDFSNNSPLVPPIPSVEIKDRTLTASIENIVGSELDAKYIKFNIVKDNTTSVYTSDPMLINTTSNYVSYRCEVAYGSKYRVRACSVGANEKESAWSDFSSNAETKPSAPSAITTYRRNKRRDGSISAYLEWAPVTNATKYIIEYVTVQSDFDNAPGNIIKVETDSSRTSIEITDIDPGYDYFFRVRASNTIGDSDPTEVVIIPIGEPPAAPTTWSSSNSAFVGDNMELSWTHNSRDGSSQTFAQLSLKIGDLAWVSYTLENTTNETTGERQDEFTFTYGTAISYKGSLYVKLDTSHADLRNAKIQWKVRTAGVTDAFSDTDWSAERTIYIYERPTLELSVTNDLAGDTIVGTLTALPFYIRGRVDLSSYTLQRPIGYHLQVIANDFYETIDDAGRTKTINVGDAVYSKYFDTSEVLVVEMSADNIDLESGITYTVRCAADMSTGLSVEQTYDFPVEWTDVEYTINADVNVNPNSFTAIISPYCVDAEGNYIENVTLAVYRREYDGSLVEIASDIPNNGTSISDPHPALDYARYRLIARDMSTGAISFYDMPGHPVKCSSVIIQWDEAWSKFDIAEENSVEGPPWSGSMLILRYNVSISDSRKRDVSLVNYAGREYPVSYYGTQIGETSRWTTAIPKTDTETIYALRRLSLWAGNVYAREPSGMGFWANVVPTFNVNYDGLTIPVTLEVTRVEGGV